TDFWGDIPDKEAGLARDNLTPHYDSQSTVLDHIQTLLNDAISNLQTGAASNSVLPHGDDLIHSGNTKAWIKTAYILKTRYHNRLLKKDATGSANNVLADIDSAAAHGYGLTSNSDDANAIFDGTANLNTWFDFDNTRADYIKAGRINIG